MTMTKEQLYDLARKRWDEPAVCTFGGECLLGYWVKKTDPEYARAVFTCKSQGVVVVVRAASWAALGALAGLVEPERIVLSVREDGSPLLAEVRGAEEPQPAITGIYEKLKDEGAA